MGRLSSWTRLFGTTSTPSLLSADRCSTASTGWCSRRTPGASVLLSYQMPTYEVGRYRLYVGVWKHGVSFYGWEQGRDSGFSARHPELVTTKRTIRLRPDDAAAIRDDELRDLLRAALGG